MSGRPADTRAPARDIRRVRRGEGRTQRALASGEPEAALRLKRLAHAPPTRTHNTSLNQGSESRSRLPPVTINPTRLPATFTRFSTIAA